MSRQKDNKKISDDIVLLYHQIENSYKFGQMKMEMSRTQKSESISIAWD